MSMLFSIIASFKKAIKKIGYKEKSYCDIITPLNTYRNVDYATLRVSMGTLQFTYFDGATVTVCNKTVIIKRLLKKG